jgi:hypothetical protein
VAGGLVGGAYILYFVLYFGYHALGAAGVAAAAGPGKIEFGTDYRELSGDAQIVSAGSSLGLGDQIAWVARLRGPANTTRVDLVVSRVTPGGGEQVINRSTMNLANPKFTVLYGKNQSLSGAGAGTYRLRAYAGDAMLAEGEFTLH